MTTGAHLRARRALAPHIAGVLHRLRAAPKRAGLTQVEVALRLKKPQSYVSKYESGERRIDATEVVAFADLYAVSIEELVRGPLPGGS